MSRDYKTFLLSDEPKIAGFPITTGLPLFALTGFGVLIGNASVFFMIGLALSGLMFYQFGGLSLRVFLSIAYWSLPKVITQLFFPSFPDSSNRLYIR